MASGSIERALIAGRQAFGSGWTPDRIASAPGRLELLGNHIDYNGGPVLAAAIDRIVVVLSEEGDRGSAEIDAVFADVADAGPTVLDASALADWRNAGSTPHSSDYLRGAVSALIARPHLGLRTGIRLAIAGDVPIGFGLSSSAALCVGLILALAQSEAHWTDIALAAQEAEHRAGTPCGTMDQAASLAGGVILFDSATLAVRQLDPDLGTAVFAVADSGVHRALGSSSYPIRVRESHDVLALARRHLRADLNQLAEVSSGDLNRLEESLGADMPAHLLRRARHVVSETERVGAGSHAIAQGDWSQFGRLMTASGKSSAGDYEISHPRVDELVAEALAVPGVYGARMMGGGEGGTALILLERQAVQPLDEQLRAGYFRRHAMSDRLDLVHMFGFAPGAAIHRWSSTSF